MPELPDIESYLQALRPRIVGEPILAIQLRSPFFLRSITPDIELCEKKTVRDVFRMGKRVVLELDDELFLVFHLMIGGRFQWRKPGTRPRSKMDLGAFQFPTGTLLVTEASQKKRASLHVVAGRDFLVHYDPQGLEVLETDLPIFQKRLQFENHTLKRALTDPHLFSGIGNAYSDEILHAARLSPFQWTQKLTDEQVRQLFEATVSVLTQWVERLSRRAAEKFPATVTAFHPEMAVHGKYGEPCPVCGTRIARIVFSENEMNYCPRCQTNGKVLADRSLSKLLKDDWPRTIEEWERTVGGG